MDSSVWLIIGLIAGGVIGGVSTWSISRARGGAVSVMKLKQENEKFRNEVTEHFVETARLINQMTDSYKQVFDHLSSGAEKLVDDEQLAERLPPASGQEVRLGGFGSGASNSNPQSSASAQKTRPESSSRDRGNPGRPATAARTQPAGKPGGRDHGGTSDAKPDPLKSAAAGSGPEASSQGVGSDKAASSETGTSGAQAESRETESKRSDSSTADKARNKGQ